VAIRGGEFDPVTQFAGGIVPNEAAVIRASWAYSSVLASNFAPGWCGVCGRKRGADGRCGDCDGWWTSPLLTLGGPAIALGTALLLLVLPLLRPASFSSPVNRPVLAVSVIPSAPANTETARLWSPPPVVFSAPRIFSAVAITNPVAASSRTADWDSARLRAMTDAAAAAEQAREAQRFASGRPAYAMTVVPGAGVRIPDSPATRPASTVTAPAIDSGPPSTAASRLL
jgi:hypothetical protein